jgi:hypothetical protein
MDNILEIIFWFALGWLVGWWHQMGTLFACTSSTASCLHDECLYFCCHAQARQLMAFLRLPRVIIPDSVNFEKKINRKARSGIISGWAAFGGHTPVQNPFFAASHTLIDFMCVTQSTGVERPCGGRKRPRHLRPFWVYRPGFVSATPNVH